MLFIVQCFSYAWHSFSRNLKRSLITIFAVLTGTFAMIFLQGLMYGLMENNIQTFTSKMLGKVQAHTQKYLDERGLYDTLPYDYVLKVTQQAKKQNIGYAERSMGGGLVAFGKESNGVQIIAVNPVNEKKYFTLPQSIEKGRYLSNKANKEVVLGSTLASLLHVAVGKQVTLIVSAADGSMGNDLYTVVGIFSTVSSGFDKTAFVFHKDDYADLFSAKNYIHEIAFTTLNHEKSQSIYKKLTLNDSYKSKYLKTWQILNPVLASGVKNMGGFINIFVYIFAIASAIGVLNTMLMAAKERVREFGMLEAIGTTRTRLVFYTAFEGLLIGLIGAILGAILAIFALLFMIYHGINLAPFVHGNMDVMGMGMNLVWYGNIRLSYFTFAIPLMVVLSFLASLYPALKILHINVIEAIRNNE